MAKCEEGYLCEICGAEVEDLTQSDLYLRYVIGMVDPETLHTHPERHILCNPLLAQFIVDDGFEPVVCDDPAFDKRRLPAPVRSRQEQIFTLAWRRLQEVRGLGLAVDEYPLPPAELA